MNINPDWKSRKWFLVLIMLGYGILVHIFPSVAEKVPRETIENIAWVLLGWLGVQGVADIVKMRGEAKKKEIAAQGDVSHVQIEEAKRVVADATDILKDIIKENDKLDKRVKKEEKKK